MPRWKALPEELDPQAREFADQLRRLVDRSGLSLAAVADRTGYSRTSWERYLNGRLLAPRAAILALAEVTGAAPADVMAMWQQAERAWSRSRTRHAATMDGERLSRVRDAPAAAPTRARRGLGVDDGRKALMFLAGIVGALLVVAAAVLVTDLGGPGATGTPGDSPDGGRKAAEPPSPSASPSGSATGSPPLPAGVKCTGAPCDGRDPATMGCGGKFATTVSSTRVGAALVEVRHSGACGAAWARISGAAPGDTVRITVGGRTRGGVVDADGGAYTPMLAVASGADARACATLVAAPEGCTTG